MIKNKGVTMYGYQNRDHIEGDIEILFLPQEDQVTLKISFVSFNAHFSGFFLDLFGRDEYKRFYIFLWEALKEVKREIRAHEIEHAPDIDPREERILVCPIAKRLIDYTECMQICDVCSYMIKPDHYDELLDLDTFDQKKRNICLNCHYLYYDD